MRFVEGHVSACEQPRKGKRPFLYVRVQADIMTLETNRRGRSSRESQGLTLLPGTTHVAVPECMKAIFNEHTIKAA